MYNTWGARTCKIEANLKKELIVETRIRQYTFCFPSEQQTPGEYEICLFVCVRA